MKQHSCFKIIFGFLVIVNEKCNIKQIFAGLDKISFFFVYTNFQIVKSSLKFRIILTNNLKFFRKIVLKADNHLPSVQ